MPKFSFFSLLLLRLYSTWIQNEWEKGKRFHILNICHIPKIAFANYSCFRRYAYELCVSLFTSVSSLHSDGLKSFFHVIFALRIYGNKTSNIFLLFSNATNSIHIGWHSSIVRNVTILNDFQIIPVAVFPLIYIFVCVR